MSDNKVQEIIFYLWVIATATAFGNGFYLVGWLLIIRMSLSLSLKIYIYVASMYRQYNNK